MRRFSVKHSVFDIDEEVVLAIVREKYVGLIGFCLMPNHFHMLVVEKNEGGIARYMQRVLNGYTKYYNAKYGKSGHLFQGPYKTVHVGTNEQLLHLSSYIHRNPRELAEWRGKEHKYPWSSYGDYVGNNRWGDLLEQDILLEQFKNEKEGYEAFLTSSTAKLSFEELREIY